VSTGFVNFPLFTVVFLLPPGDSFGPPGLPVLFFVPCFFGVADFTFIGETTMGWQVSGEDSWECGCEPKEKHCGLMAASARKLEDTIPNIINQ